MKPSLCVAVSSSTMYALLDFQNEHGKELDPAAVAEWAIREWLQRQRDLAKPAGQRGYLWKKLFLPDGTRLRISSHTTTRYASIVGDDLVHESMQMSPNQFAQMTVGAARNAWHVIQVQFPGERDWKMALRLRHALEAQVRRDNNRPATAPDLAAPAKPLVTATAPALPAEMLPAPRLRPDAVERRHTYRRAEDLLLD